MRGGYHASSGIRWLLLVLGAKLIRQSYAWVRKKGLTMSDPQDSRRLWRTQTASARSASVEGSLVPKGPTRVELCPGHPRSSLRAESPRLGDGGRSYWNWRPRPSWSCLLHNQLFETHATSNAEITLCVVCHTTPRPMDGGDLQCRTFTRCRAPSACTSSRARHMHLRQVCSLHGPAQRERFFDTLGAGQCTCCDNVALCTLHAHTAQQRCYHGERHAWRFACSWCRRGLFQASTSPADSAVTFRTWTK